jgi:hypothetical protein
MPVICAHEIQVDAGELAQGSIKTLGFHFISSLHSYHFLDRFVAEPVIGRAFARPVGSCNDQKHDPLIAFRSVSKLRLAARDECPLPDLQLHGCCSTSTRACRTDGSILGTFARTGTNPRVRD